MLFYIVLFLSYSSSCCKSMGVLISLEIHDCGLFGA